MPNFRFTIVYIYKIANYNYHRHAVVLLDGYTQMSDQYMATCTAHHWLRCNPERCKWFCTMGWIRGCAYPAKEHHTDKNVIPTAMSAKNELRRNPQTVAKLTNNIYNTKMCVVPPV